MKNLILALLVFSLSSSAQSPVLRNYFCVDTLDSVYLYKIIKTKGTVWSGVTETSIVCIPKVYPGVSSVVQHRALFNIGGISQGQDSVWLEALYGREYFDKISIDFSGKMTLMPYIQMSGILQIKNNLSRSAFVSRGTIDPLGRKIKSRASALIRGTKQMCSIKLF